MKILHMVGRMDLGGQETFIMNAYRKIDKNKIQFDFIVHSDKPGYYDDEIRKMGGKIYVISRITSNPIKHVIELYKILKNNHYDVLHRHTNLSIVFIDLIVAKFCKVKKRIVHCHSTSSNKFKISNTIFRPLVNYFSTCRIACSFDAGVFMFGKKKFEIINNGIDLDKFYYNEKIRKDIRKKYNVKDDEFIIGHVGRFTEEKNHEFIINLFENIVDGEKQKKFFLWLIGDGPNISKIKEIVRKKRLEDYVLFLGNLYNVCDYLQAFDCFIFPSKYEGLGISLIEAQASGLKCIINSTIPDEAIVTKNVKRISTSEKEAWLEYFFKNIAFSKRQSLLDKKEIYNFSIDKTVNDLCDIYYDRREK